MLALTHLLYYEDHHGRPRNSAAHLAAIKQDIDALSYARKVSVWQNVALSSAFAGRLTDADLALRTAAALEEEHADTFELARSQALAASLGDQPVERLDAAFHGFDALAATPWRASIERQLREHGYPVPRPPQDASAATTLTDLDRQLIRCVAEGLTNQEIGKRLSYSPKTIEAYLSRLHRKMGCSSRIGLLRALEPGDLLALR